jgi:5,10-methenyltetrahydromethanopterin hydrogenase
MTDAFVKKNVKLSLEFDDYLVKHPELFDDIPNKAYIVITVHGDAKFNKDSLSVVKDMKRKKVVEAHKSSNQWSLRPLQLQAA